MRALRRRRRSAPAPGVACRRCDPRGEQRLRRRREHRLADQRACGAGRGARVGDGEVAGTHFCWRTVRGPRRPDAQRYRRAGSGVGGARGKNVMEREVPYCTTEDGVRIAYCVEGEGPPLVVVAEFAESFSLLHLFPPDEAFVQRLGEGRTLIRYDARGCGLSQREVNDLSSECLLRDLEAVIRASGVQRFALFGATEAGIPSIRYAARHPRLTERLVLYGAFARVPDVFNREMALGFAQMARGKWPTAARILANTALGQGYPEAALGVGKIIEQATTGGVMARYTEASYEADVSDELSKIKCPTLVLHRMDDQGMPISAAHTLATTPPSPR